MATVVLQTIGAAVGGAIAGPIGAMVGRAAGAVAGNAIDQNLFSEDRVIEGPRLETTRWLSSTEGTPIPRVYGRYRVSGQIIWATRFREVVSEETVSSGKGGGGASTTNRSYSYYVSFAVALCEGSISGIRRIWADAQELDQTAIELRIYNGESTQEPDPLIESKQGQDNTPAYRNTAYVVFDDLPLAAYGNRIPQLSFEVIRAVGKLEKHIRTITLIPGVTEYGYDTRLVSSGGQDRPYSALNRHTSLARTDWTATIDELQMVCPQLERVSLVIAWFGNDLRAGRCQLKPGIMRRYGSDWSVDGYNRNTAHLVSSINGHSVFGGTPGDRSVINAIKDLHSRGLKVTICPIIEMDIHTENTLGWIDDAVGQPAYPWRGEISCFPPPSHPSSIDNTSRAASQINTFGRNYRVMIAHCSALAAQAGGVESFLIGSQLRGLTTVRDSKDKFPFVGVLKSIAADVRKALGSKCLVSYGADWSEYFGYCPDMGSGDLFYHLDGLWADDNMDAVGIDNYMPLSDWKYDGDPGFPEVVSGHDRNYLAGNIVSGEGYEWRYANEQDRSRGHRLPIADQQDSAVFRFKDMIAWWSSAHHEYINGVRRVTKTKWVPHSKPIWFTQIGCPAITQGSNQPNLFYDTRLPDQALPHHSSGVRDDLIQRRFLEAHYQHWQQAKNNPVSPLYGAAMIDMSRISPWAWDARPFPWFPIRTDIWSDGKNWHRGHWLNGRLGGCSADDLLYTILADFGFTNVEIYADGVIDGYIVPGAVSARAALEPLLSMLDINTVELDGKVVLRGSAYAPLHRLTRDDLVQEEEQVAVTVDRAPDFELPQEAIVHHVSVLSEYEDRGTKSRRLEVGSSRQISMQTGMAMPQATAVMIAENRLRNDWAGRIGKKLVLATAHLDIRVGDRLVLSWAGNQEWLITRSERGVRQELTLRSLEHRGVEAGKHSIESGNVAIPKAIGMPLVQLMDLPLLRDVDEGRSINHIAVTATPWGREYGVLVSPTLSGFELRKTISSRAVSGVLLSDLSAGVAGRWDHSAECHVRLQFGRLQSLEELLILNGGNLAAVESQRGVWELIQFAGAELQHDGSWRLTRLLRGQAGTNAEMVLGAKTGSRFVLLDSRVVPIELNDSERGIVLNWRIGPLGYPLASEEHLHIRHINHGRNRKMFSPVHLQGRVNPSGDHVYQWIRRGRIRADNWQDTDIPLDARKEEYRIEILDNSESVIRQAMTNQAEYTYKSDDYRKDFRSTSTAYKIRVAQIGDGGNPGVFANRIGLNFEN